MEGIIKFYKAEKRYGVVRIEGGQSFFFHESSIVGDPVSPFDSVWFELADDDVHPGQMMAVKVQKIAAAQLDPTRLLIANLSYSISEEELSQYLSECGSVSSVHIVKDENEASRGFGFARMADARSALDCIAQLHGREICGRRITVHLATERRQMSRRTEVCS